MSQSSSKRINLWMPILFSIVLILGMFLGFKLNNSATLKKSITSIIQNNRVEEIISLINNRYVDPVDEEELYREGINGIMSNLDPHTYYIPIENVDETNARLKGNYKGLGLEYSIEKDTPNIISIVDNGPAQSAGLRLGDKIMAINNTAVANNAMTMEGVKNVLRNSLSDTVYLDIIPYGSQELQQKMLVRYNIHVNSVEANYHLAPQIGYIRIGKFSEHTYDEFRVALMQLKPKELTSLVLDLRQNSGGYLDAAVKILDELFVEDKLLLTINGKSFIKDEYISTPGGMYETGKLVVLIDETTASSSEIIAGAVQDWDRGVVIGRNSFGKGLVQEQFDLSDGSALRLTVARYYTPSGRSIQRTYALGKEAYERENDARLHTLQNWEVNRNDEDRFLTLGNQRTVYANEGIMPDEIIKYKEFMLSPNLWHVANGIDKFVNDYFVGHLHEFLKYGTFESFNREFTINQKILQEFRGSLNAAFEENAQSVWRNSSKIDYIKVLMKAHFARLLFRNQGYYKVINGNNDIIDRTLQILKSEESYQQILFKQ